MCLHEVGAPLTSTHCHMSAEKLNRNGKPISWCIVDVHHSVCKLLERICSLHSPCSAAGALDCSFHKLYTGHLIHVIAQMPWHGLQLDVELKSLRTSAVIALVTGNIDLTSLCKPLHTFAGQNNTTRDDGAQMYTGIDARTLNKKTSNKGSPSSSRTNSRRGSRE